MGEINDSLCPLSPMISIFSFVAFRFFLIMFLNMSILILSLNFFWLTISFIFVLAVVFILYYHFCYLFKLFHNVYGDS